MIEAVTTVIQTVYSISVVEVGQIVQALTLIILSKVMGIKVSEKEGLDILRIGPVLFLLSAIITQSMERDVERAKVKAGMEAGIEGLVTA